MFSTIQGRMLIIFAAFALLLGGVVATTRSVLSAQADDGLIVNLGGRQRMLSQKMTKESLQLTNALLAGRTANVAEYRSTLRNTMQLFETTLLALRDGGPAPINIEMTRMRQVPPAMNEELRARLDDVVKKWAPFKEHLVAIMNGDTVDAEHVDGVIAGNGPVLVAMNAAVDVMQAESEHKVGVLNTVQMVALLLGFALVVVGVMVARSTISQPLTELASAARAMSTGNLNVEFRGNVGTSEVRELSDSFDRMRASMIAALDAGGRGASDDDL